MYRLSDADGFMLVAIDDLKFIPEKESSFKEHPKSFRKILYSIARIQLEKNNFWHAYGSVHFKYDFDSISDNFRLYRGLFYRFDIIKNSIFLSIDPQTRITSNNSLWEIIQKEGVEKAKTHLKSKFIVEKSGRQKSVCSVVKIDDSLTVSDKIPMGNQNMSVLDYWKKSSPQIASKISESECLIQVQYGENSGAYSFAPSLLYETLDTENIPRRISKELFLNPESRYNLIFKFLKYFNPLQTDDIKIQFDEKDILSKTQASTLQPPTLVFGNGKISPKIEDMRIGFKTKKLKELGPEHSILVYKTIPIIAPQNFPKKYATDLYNEVKNQVRNHLKVELPQDTVVWNYYSHPSELFSTFKDFKEKIAAGIIIIPSTKNELYFDFKRMFGNIPTQMFTSSTVKQKYSSPKEKMGVYKNKIFVGALGLMAKMQCRPWILDNSLNFDFNIGIDVGGRTGRVVCYSYVFDNSGKYLGIGLHEAQKKESIESKNIENAFVSIIKEKGKSKINSVAIYRDGYLTKDEINGLKNGTNQLMDDGTLSQDCIITGINVRKSNPFRFFNEFNNRMEDCNVGTYFELDEKSGIVATTGRNMIGQGMSRPLLVEQIPLTGSIEVREVLQDVYYLSNLNWGSPNFASRLPATIKYRTLGSIFSVKISLYSFQRNIFSWIS